MKPTKNSVFCYGCRRTKMLFETQSKADNFIRFNKEEILEENGKAPVRSYYCTFCNGYHVTSNPSVVAGERLNTEDELRLNSVIQKYKDNKYRKTVNKQEKHQANYLKTPIQNKIQKAYSKLVLGKIHLCKAILDECLIDLELATKECPDNFIYLFESLNNEIMVRFALISDIEYYSNLSKEEQTAFISRLNDNDKNIAGKALHNYIIIKEIEKILEDNEDLISKLQMDDAKQGLLRITELCGTIITNKRKPLDETSFLTVYPEYSTLLKNQYLKLKAHNRKPLEYKQTLLTLIQRIDSIKIAFKNEEYDQCLNMIDVSYSILDELRYEDENTRLIRSELDKLSDMINNL